MTDVLTTREELTAWLSRTTGPRGVVLTMGALHAGHMSLVDAARGAVGTGTVMVTVFVNPTQFGPNEDFARYPRSLDADIALCEQHGVDAVFAPSVEEVYPPGEVLPEYRPGTLAEELEGKARPGHFVGVLKVVSRLLRLTAADVTCFGEKDYQQLTLVRRLPDIEPTLAHVQFLGVPTLRDIDGLALSSRNRYLSEPQRQAALAIPRCIELVRQICAEGLSARSAALEGFNFLLSSPGVVPDYVTIRGVDLGPAPERGPARLLIAATVGDTRLLDNAEVMMGGRA